MDHYIPCMFTAGPTKAGVEATVNYGSDFSERNTYDAGDYPDQDTRLWKEEDLVASFGEFCATTSSKFDLAGLIRAYGIPACPARAAQITFPNHQFDIPFAKLVLGTCTAARC